MSSDPLHLPWADSRSSFPFRRKPDALKREPLQSLPVSPNGTVKRFRQRTIRPLPSVGRENYRAVMRAISHRQVTMIQNVNQAFEEVEQAMQRLRQTQQRITEERTRVMANQGPAARVTDHPRLSMPLPDSDGSSEPDLSILGMTRPPPVVEQHVNDDVSYDDVDDEILSQDQYDNEETSIEEEHEVEEENEVVPLIDPATAGLKEISNLGKFTVSSHKPGNGVEELRSDDLKRFWQSDGPQPHKVTVYFVKRVGIRDIRFYVDYSEDESYTPTKVVFKSGTSENNLIEFASMTLDSPVGWQQVPIVGAGGDPDGNTLVSYVLQMQILENHQNGKDTHLRGIKIYAFDSESTQGAGREHNPIDEIVDMIEHTFDPRALEDKENRSGGARRTSGMARYEPGEDGLAIPDFMREPEIR